MLHLLDTKTLLLIALAWAAAAYLIVPALWVRHFRRHPFLAQAARITQTGDGHPGDPINIGLVGSEEDVVRAMTAAGWYPADPITFASSLRIAADTVLRRPDDDAPVSNLFLFGRKQDLAFEQPLAGGPGKRATRQPQESAMSARILIFPAPEPREETDQLILEAIHLRFGSADLVPFRPRQQPQAPAEPPSQWPLAGPPPRRNALG